LIALQCPVSVVMRHDKYRCINEHRLIKIILNMVGYHPQLLSLFLVVEVVNVTASAITRGQLALW
jgi:hypothetical protein